MILLLEVGLGFIGFRVYGVQKPSNMLLVLDEGWFTLRSLHSLLQPDAYNPITL